MPTLKQKEVAATLNQFYQRPVAMVSLELFLSIGLVIFLGIFAIQPTLVTMSDLIKEREEKIALEEKLEKKIVSLQTVQEVYSQIEPQLYLLDEAIPKQPQLIKLLKIIEKTATDKKVIINSISSEEIPDEVEAPASAKNGLQQVDLPITLNLSGDYISIRAFVEELRKTRRTYIINGVSFIIQEDRGDKQLHASLSLSVPYLGVPIK